MSASSARAVVGVVVDMMVVLASGSMSQEEEQDTNNGERYTKPRTLYSRWSSKSNT